MKSFGLCSQQIGSSEFMMEPFQENKCAFIATFPHAEREINPQNFDTDLKEYISIRIQK